MEQPRTVEIAGVEVPIRGLPENDAPAASKKPPPKKHAGRAGHVARPVKRGFRPGHPSQNLFDLNRGEPGPERKPRKVKGMRCGPAGPARDAAANAGVARDTDLAVFAAL